ncbi:MAG: phosphoribosyltransferase family protein [Acidimicrobiia bacterium]
MLDDGWPIWSSVEDRSPNVLRVKIRAAIPEAYAGVLLDEFSGRLLESYRHTAIVELVEVASHDVLGFLEFMRTSKLLMTSPIATWTLTDHSEGTGRTPTGQLVYDAKYQGDVAAAEQLAIEFCQRMVRHPAVTSSDLVVPVPGRAHALSEPLAMLLARKLSAAVDVKYDSVVKKTSPSAPIKNTPLADREQLLKGVFRSSVDLGNKRVTVVDDLVQTGSTVKAVSEALMKAGAVRVVALAATAARPWSVAM